MYDHYFSNFGSSPVPEDICKDSAIRHARFWRRRFLKVFSHTNAKGSKRPCRKKVKRQCTTILLAILVDLPSPMIPAKVQPKAFLVLEEKIFKGFYHIWAWRPSWSMDRDHFSNFSFPHPKEAPYEI